MARISNNLLSGAVLGEHHRTRGDRTAKRALPVEFRAHNIVDTQQTAFQDQQHHIKGGKSQTLQMPMSDGVIGIGPVPCPSSNSGWQNIMTPVTSAGRGAYRFELLHAKHIAKTDTEGAGYQAGQIG
jgi:hypothetical protein